MRFPKRGVTPSSDSPAIFGTPNLIPMAMRLIEGSSSESMVSISCSISCAKTIVELSMNSDKNKFFIVLNIKFIILLYLQLNGLYDWLLPMRCKRPSEHVLQVNRIEFFLLYPLVCGNRHVYH